MPMSTEQILHSPRTSRIADAPTRRSRSRSLAVERAVVYSNNLGEFETRLFLFQHLRRSERRDSRGRRAGTAIGTLCSTPRAATGSRGSPCGTRRSTLASSTTCVDTADPQKRFRNAKPRAARWYRRGPTTPPGRTIQVTTARDRRARGGALRRRSDRRGDRRDRPAQGHVRQAARAQGVQSSLETASTKPSDRSSVRQRRTASASGCRPIRRWGIPRPATWSASDGSGAGSSARRSTSSIVATKVNAMFCRTSSECRADPSRCAFGHDHLAQAGAIRGQHLSFTPPISSTLPRSVTSPVIATSRRTGRRLSTLAIASVTAMPALGPSFGIAPAGKWMCRSLSRNSLSSMSSCVGARANVRVRGVDRLAHHVAELAGDREAARCPACAAPRSA